MTVETQTIREDYIGDSKTRTFWYHNRVILDTDVVPYINEVSGTMPFGTTLQNDGHNGVLISFTTAPVAGATVSLRLEEPVTQEQDYVENNPFPADTLEDALDKLTLLIQQLYSTVSYNNLRTERVPLLDAPITEELTAVLRAGKWRTWDVFGQPSSTANPSLFPTGSAIFDSVALLRAAPTPSAAGGYFITKGALNSGDGGANIWEWSVASTATDDVGTFVKPNAVNPANPGRYVSIYQGKRNVRQYGAIADGVTNVLSQFVACAAANPGFIVPAGSYMLASAFNLPAFCSMTVYGRILGPGGTTPNVRVNGGVVDDSLGTDVTNGVPGNYGTYPVGSTVFTGPFQAAGFQVGDAVGVERGTTSIANSVINQCARDFRNVVAITSTTITLDGAGTRFAYDVPRIARVPWLPYTGTLIGYGAGVGTIGTRFIAGNYTSIIQAGDVIQIENIAGTDTWYGNAFYNERVRCKSITSAGIVLENMLANSYTNPQIVRTRSIEGISIDGTGFIDFFEGYNAGTFKAEKLSFRAFSLAWSDGGLVNQINVDSDLPRAAGLTWCRNFIVSDVISKNAFAVTDNAAFKSLGCWDCTFSDIAGYGTSTSNGAGGQTAYPFFVDGLFTPYCGYASGCVFTALNCDVSFSGSVRSAWFGLTRRCRIDGLKGAADFFLDRSMDTHLTDVTIGGSLEFNANTRCTIDADAATFRMRGGFACWFYGTSRGAYGTNNNRCVSIEGSTAIGYEISKNIGISVRVVGGKSTDVAFHLDHVDGWTMTGCSDAGTYDASTGVLVPTALAKSIDIGSVTSNPRLLGDNILVNPKDFISDWTPTVSGGTIAGAPTYAAFGIYGAFEYSGNFVDVVGGVTWTGAGGAAGDIRVLMPFTLKNTPSAQQGVPCVFSGVGATLNQYYLRGNPGDLFLTLFSISALGAEAPVSWTTAPTGSIRFSGKYYAQ
jgi:hypothetical protein